MHPELAKYVPYVTGAGTLWAIYEHLFPLRYLKKEISQLKKEKAELDQDIVKLRDEQGVEGLKRVERALLRLNPSVCPVCKELLLLSVSTTFVGAMLRLDGLLDSVASWQNIPNTATVNLLLDALDKTCQLGLWSWSLENSDGRRNPERLLIRRAIEVYAAIVPHLSNAEKEVATQFCVDSCERKTGELQIDAAVVLLPRLLRHSPDDQRLVDSYLNLLQIGRAENVPEEQQTLLHGLFSGLQEIAEIRSASILRVWELAFWVAAGPGEWRRLMLQRWQIAVSQRLPGSRKVELVALRKMIADYMTNHPDAPSHDCEYFEISSVAAAVRRAINPDDKGFRPPNRAVVPLNVSIPLQITPKGDSSSAIARLVNFSVDDVETGWRRGAWATGHEAPQPPGFQPGVWCDATVTVNLPTPVVFEQAKVKGTEEGTGDHFWGYRILLGPPAREDAFTSLRRKWEAWPKR